MGSSASAFRQRTRWNYKCKGDELKDEDGNPLVLTFQKLRRSKLIAFRENVLGGLSVDNDNASEAEQEALRKAFNKNQEKVFAFQEELVCKCSLHPVITLEDEDDDDTIPISVLADELTELTTGLMKFHGMGEEGAKEAKRFPEGGDVEGS